MTDPGPADPLPFPHFYSPPLAGRDDILVEVYECFEISTHTPLAGRDACLHPILPAEILISTHTPLAGRDNIEDGKDKELLISTHTPLAGRDDHGGNVYQGTSNVYSHAPCGT